MKKSLKISLIIIGIIIGFIILDTTQAIMLNNSPIISWKTELENGNWMKKGLFTNSYYCTENQKITTVSKKEKFICPITQNTIHYSKTIDNITIELDIPNEWNYEELQKENDFKYALKLYKNEKDKNATLYFYNNHFAVCGTGLSPEKIILNNQKETTIGYYYDDMKNWNYISSYETNPNIAILNHNLDEKESSEVLEFVKTLNIRSI